MLRPEDLAEFEAAGIHRLLAEQHSADWAEVRRVFNERQVLKGRIIDEYMRVDWVAQNGSFISGMTKIAEGERVQGFSEEQLTLLGRHALGQPPVDRAVA